MLGWISPAGNAHGAPADIVDASFLSGKARWEGKRPQAVGKVWLVGEKEALAFFQDLRVTAGSVLTING